MGPTYVQSLHGLDKLPRSSIILGLRIVKPAALEVLGNGVATIPRHPVDLGDQMRVDARPDHILHHGQVFQVLVCLEQGIARVELDQDAANAPDVAGEGPT